MNNNRVPRAGAKSFSLSVLPTREALQIAIEQDGHCKCNLCWHQVAVAALMIEIDPDGSPHGVKVDAGHFKMRYKGWRYIADTPNHVKRSLMLFDVKRYDEVRVKRYTLRFRRTTKITRLTKERQEQINEARNIRKAEGRPDRTDYRTIHDRVKGFTALV